MIKKSEIIKYYHQNPTAITDKGLIRKVNEDKYYLIQAKNAHIWLLCDGMGGMEAGEMAAVQLINFLKQYFSNKKIYHPLKDIEKSILSANKYIYDFSNKQSGTTIVLLLFYKNNLYVANIGDSRLYYLTDNQIIQISKDDSLVQALVDLGEISLEESLTHSKRHILTKAIGTEEKLSFKTCRYVFDQSLKQNHLLVCSDGLYSLVENEVIQEVILNNSSKIAAQKLVDLAKEQGGDDNITVILLPILNNIKIYENNDDSHNKNKKITIYILFLVILIVLIGFIL